MIKKLFLLISITMASLAAGCIKETYDLERLSKNDHLSPTMAFPVFNGNIGVRELGLDYEVRTPSLQIRKTVGNFLLMEDLGPDNPLKPENFELIYLDLIIKNGIPLKVSIQMSLWDSVNEIVLSTVDVTGILEAASVDKNGKVIGISESHTQVKLTKQFLSSIPKSDSIVFEFTFSTPNNGANYVSLRYDFMIDFKASVIFRPDIDLK
jgi:hypothetical protein